MNADRRDEIKKLERQLTALKETAEGIKRSAESIKDDEAESKERLPENMQDGARGQAMDTNIENLESAESEIDDIVSSADEAIRNLQAAREGE